MVTSVATSSMYLRLLSKPVPPGGHLATAADLMSSPVVTVHADDSVERAGHLFSTNCISVLPVLDDDERLVGIVTVHDLQREKTPEATVWWTRPRRAPRIERRQTVRDVMTTPVESLTTSATAVEIARMMTDEAIHCFPIVDGRSVIGIVTRADFSDLLKEAVPAQL